LGERWWGGGVTFVPWQYFLNCLTMFMKMIFLNKKLKIILVPSSYFPLLSKFHYSSLLNDIQVWDINIEITNENGYKQFWMYLSSNRGWISSKWFIYLIQVTLWGFLLFFLVIPKGYHTCTHQISQEKILKIWWKYVDFYAVHEGLLFRKCFSLKVLPYIFLCIDGFL
jgi:hypothetical protein